MTLIGFLGSCVIGGHLFRRHFLRAAIQNNYQSAEKVHSSYHEARAISQEDVECHNKIPSDFGDDKKTLKLLVK